MLLLAFLDLMCWLLPSAFEKYSLDLNGDHILTGLSMLTGVFTHFFPLQLAKATCDPVSYFLQIVVTCNIGGKM